MRFARLTWNLEQLKPGRNGSHLRTVSKLTIHALLVALGVAHLLNDVIQSMIPAIYPLIKQTYRLDLRGLA